MQRFLVAYEPPPAGLVEDEEDHWDSWISTLYAYGLRLADDLSPVAEHDGIQVFEAVGL